SKFWSRPTVARLLAHAPSRSDTFRRPRSPADFAREARSIVASLADDGARAAGEHAARLLHELANRADAIDRELKQLDAHQEPHERERLEQRLTALGPPRDDDSPAIVQMRALLEGRRIVVTR